MTLNRWNDITFKKNEMNENVVLPLYIKDTDHDWCQQQSKKGQARHISYYCIILLQQQINQNYSRIIIEANDKSNWWCSGSNTEALLNFYFLFVQKDHRPKHSVLSNLNATVILNTSCLKNQILNECHHNSHMHWIIVINQESKQSRTMPIIMKLLSCIISISFVFINAIVVVSFHTGNPTTNTHTTKYTTLSKERYMYLRSQSFSTSLSYKNNKDEDHRIITKKSRVISSTPIKNLITVETLEQFLSILNETKADVTVVRFFAPWCKVRIKNIVISISILLSKITNVISNSVLLIFNFVIFNVDAVHLFLGLCIDCSIIPPTCKTKSKCHIPQYISNFKELKSIQRIECYDCTIWAYLLLGHTSWRNETSSPWLEEIWESSKIYNSGILQFGWCRNFIMTDTGIQL